MSLLRKAVKNSQRKKTESLVIDFLSRDPRGLDLHETITSNDMKGPDDEVFSWIEMWIDYYVDGYQDASWLLTSPTGSFSRLELARLIQSHYLETYPQEEKQAPYLIRLIQSDDDATTFTAQIEKL